MVSITIQIGLTPQHYGSMGFISRSVSVREPHTRNFNVNELHIRSITVSEPHTRNLNVNELHTHSVTVSEPRRWHRAAPTQS